jgi:tripartite-type tricarboxylate transporter receptor subunit TctC
MGLVAPPGTPSPIAARLSAALSRVMEDGEVRRRLVDLQADPAGSTPEQMAQTIRQETERWTQVIREARIRID